MGLTQENNLKKIIFSHPNSWLSKYDKNALYIWNKQVIFLPDNLKDFLLLHWVPWMEEALPWASLKKKQQECQPQCRNLSSSGALPNNQKLN